MAAVFWRLIAFSTSGRRDLVLSGAELRTVTGRADVGATITCSHAPTSGTLAALADGSTSTEAAWSRAAYASGGFHIVWQLAVAADIAAIDLSAGSNADEWPEGLALQYLDANGWQLGPVSGSGVLWPGARGTTRIAIPASPAGTVARLRFAGHTRDDTGINTPAIIGPVVLDASKGRDAIYFPAANGVALKMPITSSASPLLFGASDFTVQVYARPVAGVSDGYVFNWAGGLNYSWSDISMRTGGLGGGSLALASSSAGGGAPDIAYFEAVPLIPTDRFTRITLTREGPVFRLDYDGVQVWTKTDYRPLRAVVNDAGVGIGAGTRDQYGVPAEGFIGWIGGVLVINGAAVRDFQESTIGFGAPYSPKVLLASKVAASAAVPAHRVDAGRHLLLARDTEFGGEGRIVGTTKIKGLSVNIPTKARVVLLRGRDKLLARSTWSDPLTGAFEFNGIDTRQDFVALAEDLAGNYRPVAANKVFPEVAL